MLAIGAVIGALVGLIAWFVPWLPDAGSREAGPIDNLYWMVTIICIVIFSLVAGVSIYAVWKFRARSDEDEDGAPIHGHTGLEIGWTIVPAVLVTAISIYSGIVLVQVEEIPSAHRVVEVSAQQFAWSFTYPGEKVASGDLVLPAGEPVELKLTAKDVIHAFWVPEWRMKQDAVPGVETRLVITPTKEGRFAIVCTELCGLGHALMRSTAVVVSAAEFDEWLRERRRDAAGGGEGQGEELFASLGCGGCHTLADAGTSAQVGPELDGALKGRDGEFVRRAIVDPDVEVAEGFQPGVMPQDYGDRLSDAQLEQLVEYLLSATR